MVMLGFKIRISSRSAALLKAEWALACGHHHHRHPPHGDKNVGVPFHNLEWGPFCMVCILYREQAHPALTFCFAIQC
jgi:hypothetical protein